MLRVFIDHSNADPDQDAIGIQDCVKVTKALDEPLDQFQEIEAMFKGSYELEVSSPGVDRPLRLQKDYERFSGREVRINIFRPLTNDEMGNAHYFEKNSKQKNFLGTLKGVQNGKVMLALTIAAKTAGKKPAKKGAKFAPANTNSAVVVTIPLPLISKANLEPYFDFEHGSGKPAAGSEKESNRV